MTDFRPTARVIADSVNDNGNRLTTMEVTLHRFVLAELNTHRAFSRNSASSRAIPVTTTMRGIADDPALPVVWPCEKKGMQGGPPLRTEDAKAAREIWLAARDDAVNRAEQLVELGVHKSLVNRLLEPFMPHTVVITATDWDDFYTQRRLPRDGEPLAQAEIVAAAEAMWAAHQESKPEELDIGQWHAPFIGDDELHTLPLNIAVKVSAARCARVSYNRLHSQQPIQTDLDLYKRLVSARPPHWSPLEHVATPAGSHERPKGNFTGWHQLRHHEGTSQ